MVGEVNILILAFFISTVLYCQAVDETVTDEAQLTISVADYQGSGELHNLTMTVALFGKAAPMSVMNFLGLCRGYRKNRVLMHYVNTPVHRIVPDFVIQMGDVTNRDGTGGESIYGGYYDDEPFIIRHLSPGYLAMANTGRNTNGSQFYITLVKARWLDNKHIVFGKVINGMNALMELGEIPASSVTGFPRKKVTIADCTELEMNSKWVMTEQQLYTDQDIISNVQESSEL